MTGSQAVTIIIIGICVLAFGYSMMGVEDLHVPEKSSDCMVYDWQTEECYENLAGPGELVCPKTKDPKSLDASDCKEVNRCCVYTLYKGVPTVTQEYSLVPGKASEKPETFITSMFLHWDIQHLFFNMLWLFFLGTFLESLIGSGRYLITYLVCGLAGGVGVIIAPGLGLMGPDVMVVGASGAIFGVIATVAIIKPMEQIYVFFAPVPMIIVGLFYIGLQVYYMFTGGEAGVANIAHFGGAVAGILFGLYFRFVEKRHLERRRRY